MTSYNARRVHNRPFSPISTPHFHKMVLQDSLFDNKLQIPRKFIEKFGTNINTSSPVLLKVPSGEWKVRLMKCDEHVWLGKGWPEFARHHSIKCGYSLLFRYEGLSKFHVVIIDENGSEIEYPILGSTHFYESSPSMDEMPKREEETQEDDDFDSDENFNSGSPCLKRKEKSPPPFSRPKRRMKTQCYKEEMTLEEQMNKGDSQCSQSVESKGRFKSRGKKGDGEGGQVLRRMERSLTADEKDKALSRTKDFTSPNPFCKVVIQKSHVHDRLALPPEFWRKHIHDKVIFNEKSGLDATFYVPQSHGRTWLQKLQTRTVYSSNSVRAMFLGKPWQEFAVDNSLEVGDVCIFELINENEMFFKVSINREAEYGRDGQQSQAGKSEANPLQLKKNPGARFETQSNLHNEENGNMLPTDQTSESEFQPRPNQGDTNDKPGNMNFGSKSKEHTSTRVTHDVPSPSRGNGAFEGAARQSNQSFKVTLRESSKSNLRMPIDFARTNFGGKPQTVTLKVGEKLWPVNLVGGGSDSGGLVFCRGWPQFAKDNNLYPGDSCVFELVSKGKALFNVIIFHLL